MFSKIFHHEAIKGTVRFKSFKAVQIFIKTFVSSEPTLQNLEVVEIKIVNDENSIDKIINALVVALICTQLSKQCVNTAKNQYDHLKYIKLKLSNSSGSKFSCNTDILIGVNYYRYFVSGNIKHGNSVPVTAETILGWILSGTYEFKSNVYATIKLSSTHVLEISAQESHFNYGSCFQKF